MKHLTDRDYLLGQQYRDASNLQARIDLHRRFSANPQGQPRWFLQQLEIPEDAQVLDIGCGPGSFWAELGDLIPPSWRLTMADLSPGMVTEARERLAGLDRALTFLQADVQDLPFPDGSFDAVIANFMLYHVPDRPRAFAQIRRVLRPSGRLFAMTNGGRHHPEINELVNRVAPGRARTEGSGFSLENAAAQLAPWFDRIRVIRYVDALVVTEIEPLIVYIRSFVADLTPKQEATLREQIEAELKAHGAFHISKDSGLVTGVKR